MLVHGEELIGATVYIEEMGIGTVSNVYGFYSITIPDGDYHVRFSYIGYETQIEIVDFHSNHVLDIELKSQSTQLDEVVITGEQADENVKSAEMGVVKMDVKDLDIIPVFIW